MASALPTQTYWAPTAQQLGLAASSEQSEGWEQRCRVSVPTQPPLPKLVLQLVWQLEETDVTVQLGAWPPLTMTVSQQSMPLQSLC